MPKAELVALHAVGIGPISEARLEFGSGFNVLTGETGAGKTLLLGALSLCMGSSDDRGVRRDGDLRASALFRVDDVEVAFARESVTGGRLRGSIDGLTTSVEALRTRARDLVVIHGQHDSLRLRSRGESLRLLDEFGGIDDGELRHVRSRIREIEVQRDHFGGDPAARQREIEFLEYQIGEIDGVAPHSPDELTDVLSRLAELTALREHQDDLAHAIARFEDDEDSLLSQWASAVRLIPSEGSFEGVRARLEGLALEAREEIAQLARLSASSELDPEEMERLEARAGVLQALARKYGGSLASVLEARTTLEDNLLAQRAVASQLERADQELADLAVREGALAAALRSQRSSAAETFARQVVGQFERVALPLASLDVSVEDPDGSRVEISFSPNPGRAAGPLQSMASGGELSRVLLALSLVTVSDGVVAVFDEIDAGVGGSVAQQIGECLHELSLRQQVLVVTHLASVAARADRHFVVEKSAAIGATTVSVREVRGEDRVSEIARMLSGESEQRESRALAERLLGAR